jgi:hypothetical protein
MSREAATQLRSYETTLGRAFAMTELPVPIRADGVDTFTQRTTLSAASPSRLRARVAAGAGAHSSVG